MTNTNENTNLLTEPVTGGISTEKNNPLTSIEEKQQEISAQVGLIILQLFAIEYEGDH